MADQENEQIKEQSYQEGYAGNGYSGGNVGFQDNRPEIEQQLQFQAMADSSPQQKEMQQFQDIADGNITKNTLTDFPEPRKHKIRENDTYWGIARSLQKEGFNITSDQLIKWNEEYPVDQLHKHIGKEIWLEDPDAYNNCYQEWLLSPSDLPFNPEELRKIGNYVPTEEHKTYYEMLKEQKSWHLAVYYMRWSYGAGYLYDAEIFISNPSVMMANKMGIHHTEVEAKVLNIEQNWDNASVTIQTEVTTQGTEVDEYGNTIISPPKVEDVDVVFQASGIAYIFHQVQTTQDKIDEAIGGGIPLGRRGGKGGITPMGKKPNNPKTPQIPINRNQGIKRKRWNLPSSKDVKIDTVHGHGGHTTKGGRYQQSKRDGGNKDVFDPNLSDSDIEKMVFQAYDNCTIVKKQYDSERGEMRYRIEGKSKNGTTIHMWVNATTKTIESYWPKY